jgi:hypothetical protein
MHKTFASILIAAALVAFMGATARADDLKPLDSPIHMTIMPVPRDVPQPAMQPAPAVQPSQPEQPVQQKAPRDDSDAGLMGEGRR